MLTYCTVREDGKASFQYFKGTGDQPVDEKHFNVTTRFYLLIQIEHYTCVVRNSYYDFTHAQLHTALLVDQYTSANMTGFEVPSGPVATHNILFN